MLIAASHSFCTSAQQIQRYPTSSPQLQPSPATITTPLQFPPLLVVLPLLPALSPAILAVATSSSSTPSEICGCSPLPHSSITATYHPWLWPLSSIHFSAYLPPAAASSSPLLPQRSHIATAIPSSTTAAASLALNCNHRSALLTLTPQPPPSPAAATLVGLTLLSPSSLASSPDLVVVALAGPPLPPSLPLPLLPSSPQPRHRHPFFFPVVQPKAKAATILPCCRSRLQLRPPHLLPSAATSVVALPNCHQQPEPPLVGPCCSHFLFLARPHCSSEPAALLVVSISSKKEHRHYLFFNYCLICCRNHF
ncbi:hypothetical protein B296_00025730 [Ensete ventricosum]|uniref:Uncharacterized protein n=1 Tax=Ensete ventricosum TaxID=4639 RepID=A0A426YSE2_ENSVE|nr:hypothetical protein B296_00025730 [Ensete ventricosum]